MLMADSRYVPRALDIAGLSRRKSLFLFGPRQTGKTALIHRALPSAKVYDLLDGDVFRTLSHRPARLGEELERGDRLVVVDEIQKLPELLDEVHRLIEQRSIHFVLTGSSGRKLRREKVSGRSAPRSTTFSIAVWSVAFSIGPASPAVLRSSARHSRATSF